MQKRKKTGIKSLPVFMICLMLLCACQKEEQEPVMSEVSSSEEVQSDYEVEMEHREGFVGEEAYEQSFTRPQVNSNIFVDLMGYAPDDRKYAYFVGNDLSESFYVFESATEERVFTGTLKKMGNQKSDGKSVYRGDFSAITEPGVYYIQTAVIGQSYTFRIDENRYESQYEELKKEFLTLTPEEYYGAADSREERLQIYYSFQKLATAYQFFSDSFGEEYEKKLEEHAQWLLTMREELLLARDAEQKESQWKVNYTQPQEKEKQMVSEDYLFASSMAAGYTVLQPFNAPLAGKCLSQAQKAYQSCARYKLTGDVHYMAAASLFRAVGNYTYHAVVKEKYAQQGTEQLKQGYQQLDEEKDLLCDEILWGNLFYMTAVKGADMNICDGQMAELMDICGDYLDKVPKSAFGLIAAREESLERSIWLTIADYTIVSLEYRNVCKEQIHSLLHNMEEIGLSHEQKSTLLLILGNLAESEEKE